MIFKRGFAQARCSSPGVHVEFRQCFVPAALAAGTQLLVVGTWCSAGSLTSPGGSHGALWQLQYIGAAWRSRMLEKDGTAPDQVPRPVGSAMQSLRLNASVRDDFRPPISFFVEELLMACR